MRVEFFFSSTPKNSLEDAFFFFFLFSEGRQEIREDNGQEVGIKLSRAMSYLVTRK